MNRVMLKRCCESVFLAETGLVCILFQIGYIDMLWEWPKVSAAEGKGA